MSLPYRCSLKSLRSLRSNKIPGSVVYTKTARSASAWYLQRREASFQPGTHSIRRVGVNSTRGRESSVASRPDASVEYVTIAPWDPIHPAYLRDSCTCEKCVDPSSKQKNFQTTDIPKNIKAGSVEVSPDDGSVRILWENDIPGFESHKSYFPREFFDTHSTPHTLHKSRFQDGKPVLWNKKTITRELEYVNYNEYMNTDEGLFRAIRQVSKLSTVMNKYSFYTASFIRSSACTMCPSI
jgi:hypothetical protein